MSNPRYLNRRAFLNLSLVTSSAAVLAACTAPAAPTTEPVDSPTADLNQAPVPTNTQAAAAVPEAAPTTAPEAPAAAEPGKLALGKLEGPELILDKSQYPKSFNEAPMLADMVQAGNLPPVAERLPENPLVIKPLHGTGVYGGEWRSGFTGPGDSYNGIRLAGDDHILFFDYTVNNVTPNVAEGWEVSEDGKVTTLFLRKGLKWSDGEPLTADDFLFWFEDIYKNPDLWPTPTSFMAINGKQGTMEKVDDYTIRYVFEEPYFLFPEVLAGWNPLTGHSAWGFNGNGGGFAPKHYLMKFHPKYTDQAEIDKLVEEEKFDTWMQLFTNRNSWSINPDLPTVTPWKTVQPVNTDNWVLERNPYYYGVDHEGNQLPYIDRISLTLAENIEVINLRAIAGEYDFQARHIDIQKLPVFVENAEKGNYKVHLDPGDYGANAAINFIQSYDADPEIAKWITNADFRRALSQGIDRDQINEAFFLGLGTPGSVIPSPTNRYYPGDEWKTKYHTLNVEAANALLDSIGLDKKDAAGFRMRSDGTDRLRLEFICVAGQFVNFTKITEMLRSQLAAIGLDVVPKEVDRTLYSTMQAANEIALMLWDNGGTERMFGSVDNLIMWFGAPYRTWLSSGGNPPTNSDVPVKEPPAEIKELWDTWRKGFGVPDDERTELGKEIWKMIVENCYQVGLVGLSPATMGVRIVSNRMGNIPERMLVTTESQTPCQTRPSTYFIKP